MLRGNFVLQRCRPTLLLLTRIKLLLATSELDAIILVHSVLDLTHIEVDMRTDIH